MSSEEVLSRIGDVLGEVFGAIGGQIERTVTSLFGSSNARYLRRLQPLVDAINALEPKYQELTDAELQEMTPKFRKRLAAGETLDDLLIEAFAVCREAGRRVLGMRHFDVQLMGGIVLHRGNIAEMVTGEGKTLVATLPAYLNALEGRGVHVVTVNDYLARRDMEWMGPLYMSLGLTVGAIQSQMESGQRQKSYACDITYGTNNEFGFDYLRDNMRWGARGDNRYPSQMQQCQGPLHYAIIDEVDNILIDEARTPLIISGPAHDDVNRYAKADRIARQLHGVHEIQYQSMGDEEKKRVHFVINEKEHSAHLTDEGVREAEKLAGVESFYTAGNMEWPHLIDNALKAHHLYKLDVNYVINGDEVVIVDEFTGRLMPGRNWSDGLHQAVEAKEAGRGARVKEENQTLATITLQNYFKLYHKICGMTGTAMTEAAEFWKIYKLDVFSIPTNKTLQRLNNPDVIYRSEREKYHAIVEEIERMHKYDALTNSKGEEYLGRIVREDEQNVEFLPQGLKDTEVVAKDKIKEIERRGRPILVGTVSIEKSERISALLEQRGVPHQVLNAKHHQREAEIVAQAGRMGAVTIATNMAGRGTDIILGGNPEAMAWALLKDKYPTRLEVPHDEWDKLVQEIEQREQMKAEGRDVAAMGGLHIIGTERHEARRIDLQLRGRCGRQGDPGSSRFYLSLEDDLMRIFAGEWVKNILTRLGMKEGEAIVSHMVSRRVEGAQKKVEEQHFESRKNLLEYDEVMDEQRKRVYRYRQNILDGARCKDLILEMIDQEVDRHLDQFLGRDYGTGTFAEWAGNRLGVELEARDFRGMDFESARECALDQADRMVEGQVLDALEENLPEDAETSEWNWEALTKTANTRWRLSLRDRDLRQLGRDQVGEFLIGKARAAVAKIDLSDGARLLESDFGVRTACHWARQKFGIDVSPDDARDQEPDALKDVVKEQARAVYDQREIEYPVQVAMAHFSARDATGHKHFDREKLAEGARLRFEAEVALEDLKNKQRDEIRSLLVKLSRDHAAGYPAALDEAVAWREKVFPGDVPADQAFRLAQEKGLLEELSQWLEKKYGYSWKPEEMRHLTPEQFERQLTVAVEEKYRPEMRRMERALVLQILDEAWKNHLLVMDHLKSNIGLRGYAQVDPKVEYKREGMTTFEEMWDSVAQRVTDLVFKIEELNEDFVGSTWSEGEAVHEEAPGTDIAAQQEAAIEGTEADRKPEPIRHKGPRVGRNDPCPCGSGKKFKQCCMRKGGMTG